MMARRAHPTDGRQAIVELTEKGTDYINAEVSIRERWLDGQLATLTEQERRVLCQASDIIERMAASDVDVDEQRVS